MIIQYVRTHAYACVRGCDVCLCWRVCIHFAVGLCICLVKIGSLAVPRTPKSKQAMFQDKVEANNLRKSRAAHFDEFLKRIQAQVETAAAAAETP